MPYILKKIKIIKSPLKAILLEHYDTSILNFCKKIYKAEIAKKVTFKQLAVGEDVLYSFEVLSYVRSCAVIPCTMLFYVQRNTSVSHDKNQMRKYKRRILFTEHLSALANQLCHNCQNDEKMVVGLNKYASEQLFRVYILRCLKSHFPREIINSNIEIIKKHIEEHNLHINLLRLRFRIIFYLLKHKHFMLAKLLS